MDLFINLQKSVLTAETKVVHKDGKTFLQTFHVNNEPDEQKAKQQGKDLLAGALGSKDKAVRAATLKLAKTEGVAWKEDANEGINWMRASMAIKKYVQQDSKEVKQAPPVETLSKIDVKSSVPEVKEKAQSAKTALIEPDKVVAGEKILSPQRLGELNDLMLGRGAPIKDDGIGYNQVDWQIGNVIKGTPTAPKGMYLIARALTKYGRTQLGIDTEVLNNTFKYYKKMYDDSISAREASETKPEAPAQSNAPQQPIQTRAVHEVNYRESNGRWIIVGNTYPAKDLISKSGGRWGQGGEKAWSFEKSKVSKEKMDKIVAAVRSGNVYAESSNNTTQSQAATGKRAEFTGLDYRLSLSDVKDGEYGKIINTRGRKLAGEQQKLDPTISKFLRPHQLDGANLAIAAMDSYGGFLLSDGTGAGKTIQEIVVANHYMSKGAKVLIVVPNTGIMNTAFGKDAGILGIKDRLNVVDNTTGRLVSGKINMVTYSSLSKVKDKPDYIVFDEAHSMKNVGDSNRSKKGMEMADEAKGVMYATATPIDKAQHMQYMKKLGIFEANSFSKIMYKLGYRYEEKTLGNRRVGEWVRTVPLEKAAEGIDNFFSELSDLGITAKREVSMDKVTVKFHRISLPQSAHRELDRIAAHYGDNSNNTAIMLMAQRRFQEPHKLNAVKSLIDSKLKEGRKVVVFATRVNDSEIADKKNTGAETMISDSTIRQLCDDLSEKGIKVSKIFGDASVTNEVDKFQNGDCDVAVVTPEKGGAGLSLDDDKGGKPRTMIVVTPPFSAVDNVQIAGRVNRLNTQSNSEIIYITADTSVDDWNTQIITEKMKTLHAAVQGNIGKLVKSVLYRDILSGATYVAANGGC